jgi:hypothetical protein
LWILLIIVLLSVLLILSDEIASCRNHRLGLLRFSAEKSRDRIENSELGITSFWKVLILFFELLQIVAGIGEIEALVA